MDRYFTRKVGILLSLAMVMIIAVFFLPRIPQPEGYHQFADQRLVLGLPNFLNVVSNLPFFLVGLAGLVQLRRGVITAILQPLRYLYFILFAGVLLVGVGSSYYHLWPSNLTLVWDRLPMTIAFMSLFALLLAEFVALRAARLLAWPLLLVGIFSVGYWYFTERVNQGDLRLYILVQFLPMLLIPLMLLLFRSCYTHTRALWWLLLFYLLAKLFEGLDTQVYALGNLVSGHTLKHLVSALGVWVFYRSLLKRRLARIPHQRS